MRRYKTLMVGVLLVVGGAGIALAQSEDALAGEPLQSLAGSVEVRGGERDVVVRLREHADLAIHVFHLEMSGPIGPLSLRSDAAHVVWRGRELAVVAPQERTILRFTVSEGQRPEGPAVGLPEWEMAGAATALGRRALQGNEVTQLPGVTALITWSGPEALLGDDDRGPRHVFASDIDYDDPGGGGGGGASCGTSCSITCGDGSSCSASCSPPRCAKCSCPASCSCTF
jgi:hypothetical protein